MGQNRVLEGRSSPMYITGPFGPDGESEKRVLEGMLVASVPGPTSPRFPIGDVLDVVRKYGTDLPEAGVGTIVLNFNPADRMHRLLRKAQTDDTTLGFEWHVEGKPINGVKSKQAIQRGTCEAGVAAGVATDKLRKLTGLTNAIEPPAVGDFLATVAANVPTYVYVIDKVDYEDSSGYVYYVRKVDGTAFAAPLVASATYTIYTPAQIQKFSGQISGLPSQGGQIITTQMSINIQGTITNIVGNNGGDDDNFGLPSSPIIP